MLRSEKKSLLINRLIILIPLFLISHTIQAGVAVVVNPESSINSAKPKEIKKIFLGKSKKITGQPVKPIDNLTSDVRKIFLDSIVRKSPRAFKSYWTRLVFTGKAAPLQLSDDDKSVKMWVSEHRDGIGFIDSRSVDNSVKVIFETQ